MRIRWRGLELPTQVVCEDETRTDRYAKFVVEPFERGYGTTIGNSLRRVLLSSLEGAAVTSVKIEGAQHEFSALDGVLEDVADIVLNIKQLRVRMRGDEPLTLKLKVEREGDITAGDIETPDGVEITNPDLKIATLTEKRTFVCEMEIRKGRGYRTAEENADEDREVGMIPIDSIYSPVLRVTYRTVDTRVGQRTNYDRLEMQVWTDGTVSPAMALTEGGKILSKHMIPFIQYAELGEELAEAQSALDEEDRIFVDEELEKKASIPIAELGLSARSLNCLASQHINTVGDLVAMSEEALLGVRNFGQTSLDEVDEKLGQLGLHLGMGASEEGEEAKEEAEAESEEQPEQPEEEEAEEEAAEEETE